MPRKFPNIEYNLSCDKIRYNNELESLKNHSLNLRIGKIFKDILRTTWRVLECNEKFLKLEKLVSFQIANETDPLNIDPSLRKEKVHFIKLQIINFIAKYPYSHIECLEIFFPYIVFTGQGTINTMKSVRAFGMANSEFFLKRFRVTCYLFLKKDVKRTFKNLPDLVKLKVVSEMKKDFFINFCIRDAQIDHQLLRKAFDGYPHDNNSVNYKDYFFKAIDTNNEIAVEYLWRNKISKMRGGDAVLRKALIWIVDKPLKTNILIFLLFQVNENEFEDFFRSFSFKVIGIVIKEARWHCLFDKIFDVFKIYFNCDFVLKIFCILTEPYCTCCPTGLNLDLVVKFFCSLSASDKIYIVKKSTPNDIQTSSSTEEYEIPYERVLLNSLSREDYLEKMLRVEDIYALKDFFISEPGVNILSKAFGNGKKELIYNVLRKVVNSEILSDIDSHLYDILTRL
ncbi:UNVERIFIED_CONTAM: hypothetical protein RMT77_011349 [Armadillidium vulgare]